MSHFAVLVVHNEGEDITPILQPWHEYECTGIKDEYVKFVDQHDEIVKEWETQTTTMMRDSEGNLFNTYEDQFYREPTTEEIEKVGTMAGSGFGRGLSWTSKDWGDGRGYRAKIAYVPDGFEEVKVSNEYSCIEEYAREYHGCEVQNGRIGRVTNPNAKWDWWMVGGRFQGHLLSKIGGRVDSLKVKDWALERTIAEARDKAADLWDRVDRVIGPRRPSFMTWAQCIDSFGVERIDEAREFYHAQPIKNEVKELLEDRWIDVDQFFGVTRDEYITVQGLRAVTCFAYVLDGEWYEKGEMGWWACVSNEKEQVDWNTEFHNMLMSLDGEKVVTVVDCHI